MHATSFSIVLPCFNEEGNIARTVADVCGWMKERGIDGEVIAVDDGSRDRTAQILEELTGTFPMLRILRHPRNRGYGAAISTGCDDARFDVIAFMDSDGQFRARDFDTLIPLLSQADFVTGRRRKRADPFIRKLNAKLFGFLVWVLLDVWIRDINCGMKMFRKGVWQQVHPHHATGALFNAEVFSNLHRLSIPWVQADVHHYPRTAGTPTGAKLSVILRMFRELWNLRRRR